MGNKTSNKKYNFDDIINAIRGKYGNVKEYAGIKGVTDKAIYARAKNQTFHFIKELEKDGVIINAGRDSHINSHNKTYIENDSELLKEIDSLRKENNKLKDELLDAQKKIISLLKNEGT